MVILTFPSYSAARTKLDELNALAQLEEGFDLTGICVNEARDTYVINGTDCIEQGGLGRDQIATAIDGLPSFNIDAYEDLFNMGYKPVS